MKGETKYRNASNGDDGNYGWPAVFDWTDGYVGITQTKPMDGPLDRVLLSPKQVRELVEFVVARGGAGIARLNKRKKVSR